MSYPYLLLAAVPLVAGALIPLQAGANRALGAAAGDPLVAAGLSFLVGAAALMGLSLLVLRRDLPGDLFAATPAWAWTGGLFGAIFVTGAIVLAPRIGTTSYLLLVFVGQMAMAALVDHFGLVGFARRPVSLAQVAGLATVLAGAGLALGAAGR